MHMQNCQAAVAGTGDTVGLLLSIDEGSLTVFLNGARIGRFTGVVSNCRLKTPLHWMTTLEEEGDAVRISNLTGQHLDHLLDAERERLVVLGDEGHVAPPLWDFTEVSFGLVQTVARLCISK